MDKRLTIEQKITAFANKYKVLGPDGSLVAFAQQKRIAFKEKVTFFADEKKQDVAFTFRAEKVMDVHGRYFVEDSRGVVLGMFKKEFKKSLLISTWKLLDKDGNEVFTVRESNEVLAALRRFAGFIPIVGDLFEIVLLFFRYHFSFLNAEGMEVGKYQKTTLFRDHYELHMTDEAYGALDWRVIAAMGVALDALQSR
jgi:hypothetical protein